MTTISDLLKQKRQKTADKRLGAVNAYKFKGGVTTIRILPGWRKDGDLTFSHPFGQAFIKNMDKQTLAVIGDRRLTFGEDDTVRSIIQRALGEAATDAQREHYKDMLAKPRELVNALILDDREVDPKVPQLVDFSETQFDQILEQVDLAGISEEFLDLNNGFNLKVSKSGTGFNTKYSFTFDRKSTPVDASVMENVIDIDSYIRSKFQDTERAVNALKSLTQGHVEPKALSYSGSADVVEGEYDAVELAKLDDTPFEVEHVKATDADIENMFE
jgi:hypothetical protein